MPSHRGGRASWPAWPGSALHVRQSDAGRCRMAPSSGAAPSTHVRRASMLSPRLLLLPPPVGELEDVVGGEHKVSPLGSERYSDRERRD